MAAVLIGSLVVKLALWGWIATVDPSRFWEGTETTSYMAPARALAETGTFATGPGLSTPETYRTPGYPAFLASAIQLFGEASLWPILLQIVLSVATLAIVGWLAAEIVSDDRAPVAAVWIAALDVVSASFSLLLLTESLFTFVLAAAAAAGIRALRAANGVPWAATAGLLLGAAALVRPIGYYLPVPFAAALALGSVKQIGWRLALRSALTVCLSAAVGIGAWQLRNQVVAGTWVFSGVELEARSDRSVMVESLNGTRQGWSVEGESSPDLGHAPRLVVLGATILQNAAGLMLGPGEHRFIRLLGYAAPDAPGLDLRLLVVAPEPNRPSLTPGEFAAKWLRALHWPMLPFAVAALHIVALNVGLLAWAASAWRRRAFSRRDLLMWGILGYFLIVSYSSSRFRVPIMPMLSVYAAAGWLRLRPFRRTEEPVANVCDRHTWSI